MTSQAEDLLLIPTPSRSSKWTESATALQQHAKPLQICQSRLSNLTDVLADVLVLIDNATTWDHVWLIRLDSCYDGWWALIGLMIFLLPTMASYVALYQCSVANLSKYGLPAAGLLYMLFAIPAFIVAKVILVTAYMFRSADASKLTWLGTFEVCDFLMEACLEAPLQCLFTTYMFFRKIELMRSGGTFPYSILLSWVTSAYSVYKAHRSIRAHQSQFHDHEVTYLGAIKSLLQGSASSSCYIKGSDEDPQQLVEEIAWAVETPSFLEAVKVLHCNLSCIDPIGNALALNSKLVVLNLSDNCITNIDVLAEGLVTNKTLEVLILAFNKISRVDALGRALADNETLKTIRLKDNMIEDVSPLMKGLESNSSVADIGLIDNHIVDTPEIAGMMRINLTLKTLRLAGNKMSSEAQKQLEDEFGERVNFEEGGKHRLSDVAKS
eukprot:TRINITY_DN4498_c0_g1_i3.p1 TRINITY_DN4498_c0_g1~~TRINITY_DN4498_c0_g1_i3.p1  ORF type:complete len:439 (-),score=76.09 TRINITY_DN4498_c0_g1_i3:177-1493(-)